MGFSFVTVFVIKVAFFWSEMLMLGVVCKWVLALVMWVSEQK